MHDAIAGSPDPDPEVVRETIPVLRPLLPSVDRMLPYLRRIDASRIYSNNGPLSEEFERRVGMHLGLPEGGFASAASGTAALVGAILATAGRAKADRPFALMPAFTFVATASAAEQCGYRPYLADIDAETWMLDPARLADHPEQRRIGVVVPVAPFGRPVPQEPWRRFRQHTGVPVVIDGAASFEGLEEAAPSYLGDIPVALSFHATKSFSTGEGGGVGTSDCVLARGVAQTLNFGFYGSRDSEVASTNGKLSEYHAAVGLAELDGWNGKRGALRGVADLYRELLERAGLLDRLYGAPHVAGCYALFRCSNEEQTARVQASLDQHGIDFRLWYGGGLHHQTYFADLSGDALDVTEKISGALIGLPVAPDMSKSAITRVIAALTAGL